MAKAGMRRPDPKQPHGTESNKKMHIKKMRQNLFRKFKERQKRDIKKQTI